MLKPGNSHFISVVGTSSDWDDDAFWVKGDTYWKMDYHRRLSLVGGIVVDSQDRMYVIIDSGSLWCGPNLSPADVYQLLSNEKRRRLPPLIKTKN